MITLTKDEKKTLEVLGKRFKGKSKERDYGRIEPIVKERVEDTFIPTIKANDSFAFRGIVEEKEVWCENPKTYNYCPR